MSDFKKLRQKENRAKYKHLIEFNPIKNKSGKEIMKEIKRLDSITDYEPEKYVSVFKSVINHKMKLKPIKEPKQIIKKQPKPKKNQKKELAKYRKLVKQYTKEVNKQSIPGYCKAMIFDYYKHGKLCDNQDKLVIDHKIPVVHGFKNGIPPQVISHISNLQYISIEANRIKNSIPLIDDLNQWIMDYNNE